MAKKKEDRTPRYSYEVAKQLLFDCAMELQYHQEDLDD